MLRVGEKGEVGTVEMQDLLFTTQGITPGVILVEWNIKASSQGSTGLWDCHARIGGAIGTDLTPEECPAIPGGVTPGCQGASAMMHLTDGSSGYFENMWLWVADHMIDDPLLTENNNTMEQVTIYVARGILIESQDPTWLYGTASEHSTYYQYNFHNARNIFAGMVQTETPYYQPVPAAPLPFTIEAGVMAGDPNYSNCSSGGGGDFDGCDSSWAVIIEGSQDIFIAGAGLYSWFDSYTQDCIDIHACQNALVLLKDNYLNVRLQHVITIGAKYMLVSDGKGVLAADNLAIEAHPAWSQISIFDAVSNHVRHISPDDATVIPLPHTTVAPHATLTITNPIGSDVAALPKNGNQNDAPGPGANVCQECSFFRLITSTCCGTGGSIGNPIEIPANVPTPIDIPLPAGFVPNQDFTDSDNTNHPGGTALPSEATIPFGTVFPNPFVIPAGQPLRGGEESDSDDEEIWIHPSIWKSPSPTITCYIPCTFVLPPWRNATSTLDYPRVTVSDGTIWTSTITKAPMTITSWGFGPLVVSPSGVGQPSSSSSSSGAAVVIYPTISPTSTWPIITYTDDKGNTQKARPTSPPRPDPPSPPNPNPPPPPPTGSWPPPLHVINGPPGPRVNPCFFPALSCPPGSGSSSSGGGTRGNDPDGPPRDPDPGEDPEPDDDEDDDDDDEEEEEICLLDTEGEDTSDDGGSDESTTTTTKPPQTSTAKPTSTTKPTPTTTTTPEPSPTLKPDTKGNTLDCYNHGYSLGRDSLIEVAGRFCDEVYLLYEYLPGFFYESTLEPEFTLFAVEVVMSIEVKKTTGPNGIQCGWLADKAECVRYLTAVVDGCDCDSTGGKHGGLIENNCLKWRIDPNIEKD